MSRILSEILAKKNSGMVIHPDIHIKVQALSYTHDVDNLWITLRIL
jgi:hypothetical protein